MKKKYIIPAIECEDMVGDELLNNLSMISSTEADGPALSKERETVDFSSDCDWDF